jgi:hypothetical protein
MNLYKLETFKGFKSVISITESILSQTLCKHHIYEFGYFYYLDGYIIDIDFISSDSGFNKLKREVLEFNRDKNLKLLDVL